MEIFSNLSLHQLQAISLDWYLGLLVIFLKDGIISISEFDPYDRSLYSIVVLYSGLVGSDTGSIIFPIISVISVVRVIIAEHKEAKNNKIRLEEIKISQGINSPEEKRG